MPQRTKSNSVQAHVAAHRAASTATSFPWDELSDTVRLPENDAEALAVMRIADDVYRSRPNWPVTMHHHIASYALISVDVAAIYQTMRDAGFVEQKEGRNGLITVKHPLHDVHASLNGRLLQLTKLLALHHHGGDPRTMANHALTHQSAQSNIRRDTGPTAQIRIEDLLK